jgi:hypothetical protein
MDTLARRRTLTAAAIGALATIVTAMGTIAPLETNRAAAAAHGGPVYGYGSPALQGTQGWVLLTGAIGDYGPTTKADRSGDPDPRGDYAKLDLQNGSILIDTHKLQRAIRVGSEHAHIDPDSCSLHGSVSEPSPVVSGTGAYAHITGTMRITFTFAELARRTPSGSCSPDAVAAMYGTTSATGTVTLP